MNLVSFDSVFVKNILCLSSLIFSLTQLPGAIREVGPGKTFATPAAAANTASPGDTILIFPNIYPGGNYINNKHGNSENFITFLGVDRNTVIFQGGSQAFHFSEVSYLRIENITIQSQTSNGINIDDGGTYETPSHHLYINNCIFRNINASGNNDLLKMSGLDHFWVTNCVFQNGAAGGSGIDMVGCHDGTIELCNFENLGSNCIQAKGGSQFLTIRRNKFKNGGQRTLNLGGSTGLTFFRPIDAPFEAADIDVYANIFIGSTAPVAFVGCVRVYVVNNTIINPVNWVIRILQETVDPLRFLPCGQNSFVNNIIYYGSLSTHVNVGPNTASNTFIFSNNLWYRNTSPESSAPILPVSESNSVIGQNPLFIDTGNEDFNLQYSSLAKDAGAITNYITDFEGKDGVLGTNRDIGAFEYPTPTLSALIGNHYVCNTDTMQVYIVRSRYAYHFEWLITGGIVQMPYLPTDSMVTIKWSPHMPIHAVTVRAFENNGNPGSQLLQNIQVISSDTLVWQGQSDQWSDRSNWSKYTLPQSCHHVILQNISTLSIPPLSMITLRSLHCGSGVQLSIPPGSILQIRN